MVRLQPLPGQEIAEQTLELRLLKKNRIADGDDRA
jgi:hypothetical protein